MDITSSGPISILIAFESDKDITTPSRSIIKGSYYTVILRVETDSISIASGIY